MADNFTQPRPHTTLIPNGIDQLAGRVANMSSAEYDRHIKLHQHAQASADDALRIYRKAHGWDGVPLGEKISAIGGESPQEILQRLKSAKTEEEYQKARVQAVYMNTLREGGYNSEVPYSLPKTEWRALCGLCAKDAWGRYGYLFSEKLFTDTVHKKIFNTIKGMAEGGEPLDVCTIFERLHVQYDADWVQLFTCDTYVSNLPYMAKMLSSMAKKREYDNVFKAGIELLKDGSITSEALNERLKEVIDDTPIEEVATLGDAFQEMMCKIEKNRNATSIGSHTGFVEIDKLGGFQAGDFIVLAGDTSSGKTSFALTVTLNTILDGNKVAYYSLEMMKDRLAARLISMYRSVRIESSRIIRQALFEEEIALINKAISIMPNTALLFDDKATINFDDMLASIRMMAKKYGVQGVVVDYLQILNVNSKGKDTQERLMAEVARKLKNVSMECGIWVLALSQLNRDKNRPEPTLARLRDSGQIAEAADVVMFVYRPELYGLSFPPPYENKLTNGLALINIAKGRDIGTHKFLVEFESKYTYFHDIDMDVIPTVEVKEVKKVKEDKEEERVPF